MEEMGQWLERTRKSLLLSSTGVTGGAAKFSKQPARAVAAIDDSLAHYYSIAYSPPHSGDGREYRIEVSVRDRPDLRVIHRTAYVDQLATVREAQRLRSRMLFSADANPLGVRVVYGEAKNRFRLGAAGSKRVRLPVQVRIPYAGLEMIPRGDMRWGKVMVTFFSEDGTGNQSPVSTYEQPITVASSRYREAVARGYFAYKITVELEGGTQKLYVGVRDLVGGSTSVVPETFEF
jgi:hypothetical protein